MEIKQQLSTEFNLKPEYAANVVDLIGEGCTIPFIARYRKEMHGGMDDQVLREFADRLQYLTNLEKRKAEVKESIESQGKLTDEIVQALSKAVTMTEVEDIYRPYKQKKKTRASVAIEKGLEPLADIIFAQEIASGDISQIASPYINPEVGINSTDDAIAGAMDIIAERISDDAEVRKSLRQLLNTSAQMTTTFDQKQEDEGKKAVYEMYKEYSEKVSSMPSHRILAINRGEKDECLKVGIEIEPEPALDIIKRAFKKSSMFDNLMDAAIEDSYKRLIFPSIEREVRSELTDKANEQAIKMFEVNLRPLLMQPPLKGKTIMGFDPGYRTGCKVAVIDQNGNILDHTVVYVAAASESMVAKAKEVIAGLIKKHKIDVVAIGNGTASKESEIFIAGLLKDTGLPAGYIMVNEAGASVYSASKLGAEEFPEYDLTVRSAISIARRLQDPLAELIKIDVKSIGVGQYQHDMPQKRLTDVLTGVVEDCVNSVGVDLNTASYSLLSYISGLNIGIAKNIVEKRKSGAFTRRQQLLEVAKLGPKAYQQCAGFLRIPDAENILDNTAVHPESYDAAKKLLAMFGFSEKDISSAGGADEGENSIKNLKDLIAKKGADKVAAECGVGVPTLMDIVAELLRPGRDIRDSLPKPTLRADIMDISSLEVGMELSGTVRNVIDFGAFVDIGVHQDGLVHVSEISHEFIKHPSEALTVGQAVKVRVIAVDKTKNRIGLSIKQTVPAPERAPRPIRRDAAATDARGAGGNGGQANGRGSQTRGNFAPRPQPRQDNLDDMLKKLQNKFSK